MRSSPTWTRCVRGDVHRCRPRHTAGREQQDDRYAVVVQASGLPLSTWLVAPTTTSQAAAEAVFRPLIEVLGRQTRVLCEQTTAVDPQRLGQQVGALTQGEMRLVERGLRLVLDL